MLALHVALLAAVIIFTAACLFARTGRQSRPLRTILVAFLPFLLIAVVCSLLLRLDRPLVEWIAPGIAMLLIGLFCRSDALFAFARQALPLVAVLLCLNFLALTDGGYTNIPKVTIALSTSRLRAGLDSMAKRLRDQHPTDALLPPGEIGTLTVATPVREWHTTLTRLWRVEEKPATVWYPGGKAGEAAEHLQIKPAAMR